MGAIRDHTRVQQVVEELSRGHINTDPLARQSEGARQFLGDPKEFDVLGLGETELSRRNHVMAQGLKQTDCGGIDVLISEKHHGVDARWMSSAATTSMACWTQALMSSSSRSG